MGFFINIIDPDSNVNNKLLMTEEYRKNLA